MLYYSCEVDGSVCLVYLEKGRVVLVVHVAV